MKANSAGNSITYEYLNKVNPDKLFVIDRTQKEMISRYLLH